MNEDAHVSQLLTCDICSKTAFDSPEALSAHVDRTHADMAPDREDLALMIDKIRPLMESVLHPDNSEQWVKWGEKTLGVAKQRDAGAGKLAEACGARAQLDVIVRQWHPTATVYVFGSSVAMGLWDGLSDVDFIVVDVKAAEVGEWPPQEKTGVRSLGTLLRRAGFAMQNLEVIDGARVPIIKHHAPTSFARLPDKDTAHLISRSVRFIFSEPLVPSERLLFEGGVVDAVGQPEHVWWNPKGDTVGITLKNKLDAVKILVHQPVTSTASVLHRSPLHDDIRPDIFGVDFDLGFRTFGIRNSELLRRFLSGHRCARPGALVLKEWSKSSGVNNSPGGYLTSYAINILWIYYMVQKGKIPFVDPLHIPKSLTTDEIKKDPQYVPLIPPEVHSSPEALTAFYQEMGAHLIGFYAFYCFEFDWKTNVVSLNRPEVTTKEKLQWTSNEEIQLGSKGKNVRYQLCIEDPYEENLNLGRHIGECRWRKVQCEFQRALVSLIKDPVHQSSVFGWMSDAGSASEIVEGENDGDAKGARLVATPPSVTSIGTLMAIAVEKIESSVDLAVGSDDLQSTFKKLAPTEFAEALGFYSWKQLVGELGYHTVGQKVRARRNLGTRAPKRLSTQQMQAVAAEKEKTKEQNAASVAEGASAIRIPAEVYVDATPVNPLDTLTDELIAEYLQEHAMNSATGSGAEIGLQPEWLVFNGPQKSIHVPGHRGNTGVTKMSTSEFPSGRFIYGQNEAPLTTGNPQQAQGPRSTTPALLSSCGAMMGALPPYFAPARSSSAVQPRVVGCAEAVVQKGGMNVMRRLLRKF